MSTLAPHQDWPVHVTYNESTRIHKKIFWTCQVLWTKVKQSTKPSNVHRKRITFSPRNSSHNTGQRWGKNLGVLTLLRPKNTKTGLMWAPGIRIVAQPQASLDYMWLNKPCTIIYHTSSGCCKWKNTLPREGSGLRPRAHGPNGPTGSTDSTGSTGSRDRTKSVMGSIQE